MTENINHPKLFLFCIGGTGSRVLKALTFLLASGVDIKASKVIPIIIDPDKANGDVTRTIEILKKYGDIRTELDFSQNQFFKTDIQTLLSLDAVGSNGQTKTTSQGFRFGIDGTKEGKFRDFIAFDQLQGGNSALISSLFTEENLNAELRVGFKGNPHIGSIVLNKFSDSEDFSFFAQRFSENDRIFIVSSIFGGTGAAGFPLLVKNIRNPKGGISNPERLKNAKIGAITVKPYFSVKADENSKIDSGTFISKTKAALEYYDKNITGNNSVNALYYIGDTETLDYNNNEGELSQKNYAHLVEFISAMSVIDYMDIGDGKLETIESVAQNPIFKEYGLNNDVTTVNIKHLGKRTQSKVFQPLTQYTYANLYWQNNLNTIPKQPWATKGSIIYDNSFLTSEFFGEDLKQFNKRYFEWLNEMGLNERGFKPFKLDVLSKLLHTVVEGIEQKRKGTILFKKADWDFIDFDGYLNDAAVEVGEKDPNSKFISIFYRATEKIFNDRINH